MAYLDIDFQLISNENYVDVDFITYIPEHEEVSFYLQSNLDYCDSDFYFDFHIVNYYDVSFLFPGNFRSYRDRDFITYVPEHEFVDFLYHMYGHEDFEFTSYGADYIDRDFLLYSPDHEDYEFLVHSPDHEDYEFLVHSPDHIDIDYLIELGENLDTDFRVVAPYDEWYDIGFIAQTLGRGSGDFGYEYDEWNFFVPTPDYLDVTFDFEQDVQIYIEAPFFAVTEGVSEDILFLIHSDITYGYVEPSFVLINVTDNLVERSLVRVSSWIRRPGRRPATL